MKAFYEHAKSPKSADLGGVPPQDFPLNNNQLAALNEERHEPGPMSSHHKHL